MADTELFEIRAKIWIDIGSMQGRICFPILYQVQFQILSTGRVQNQQSFTKVDGARDRNWKHHEVELDDPSVCNITILVILDVHFRLDSLRKFWNLNSSVCERECFKCHAAVVIVIQLGCDVIHEIQPITAAVISVLRQFEEWVSILNIIQIKNDLSLIKTVI